MAAWPDVESVAVCLHDADELPDRRRRHLHRRAAACRRDSQPPASFMNHVGHDYFDVMGIPIVRGRAFTEDDEREHSTTRKVRDRQRVDGARSTGRGRIRSASASTPTTSTEPLLEVVGVARDSKYVLVFEAPRPYVYLPVVRDMSLRTLHRARVRRPGGARAAPRA